MLSSVTLALWNSNCEISSHTEELLMDSNRPSRQLNSGSDTSPLITAFGYFNTLSGFLPYGPSDSDPE